MQRLSKNLDYDLDLLIAESWLNEYQLSLGGTLDLSLEPGPENNFREKLLTHQCFLAMNANLQLDSLSLVHKDSDTEKLSREAAIPAHKLFMPTDIFKGHSLGRLFPNFLSVPKLIEDLTNYENFINYVKDPSNDFHLSPLEFFMQHNLSEAHFQKIVASGLLATDKD